MSSLTFRFEMVGANRIETIFDNLDKIPDDFEKLFRDMAEDFWDYERIIFDSEGPGWRPLSANYAAWKAKHFPGAPSMMRTGALKASLTGDSFETIFEVSSHEMRLGTSTPYAIYHQTGSIKVEDHPPKRQLIKLDDALQTQWNSRMAQWLRDEVDYRG